MDELLFYVVETDYIKYLSMFDIHVSYNKENSGHKRPYIGIVLKINNFKYFVPLYSYKKHYDKYKNNPSFFIIYTRMKKPISILKFSAMIPVLSNNNVIKLLEFEGLDSKYKDLVSTEYRYINSKKYEIHKKAYRMYRLVTSNKNSFLAGIACDFKLLENKCELYGKDNL